MALPLATAFVEIRPYSKSFSRELRKQLDAEAATAGKSGALAGESFAAGMRSKVLAISKGITLGLAAVGAGVAAIGVDMAVKFNSDMELLSTQAGVAQRKIKGLSAGVLKLAGQVGFSPDSLAESLFHVESNFESLGITGPKALHLVKIAAEGAATGHADLIDVTNALTAAVASGIPGVSNFGKAMGVLNATVGVGDMKMQDLADAFSTGLLASVKAFGVSITDVGAGLAVFGDNNIRGAKAGTQLRMAVQALASPTAAGAKNLVSLGIASGSLAGAMQKGGLKLAIETLAAKLKTAGYTTKETGQILTETFGKRAGVGIQILLGQLDRFESKYPALTAGAGKFGSAWAATKAQVAQQVKQVGASFDSLAIRIGEKLLPVLIRVFDWAKTHTGIIIKVAIAIASVAVSITLVSAAMKLIRTAKEIWLGITGAVKFFRAACVLTRIELAALWVQQKIIRGATAIWGGLTAVVGAFRDGTIGTRIALGALWVQQKIIGGATAIWAGITAVVTAFRDATIGTRIALMALAVQEKVVAAAQWLWNVAMDANPIGAVILGITALVAGVIWAYTHFKVFRDVVAAVWGWIKDHWKLLLIIITGPIGLAIDIIVTQWHKILPVVMGAFNWIRDHWKLLLILLTGPVGLAVVFIVDHWKLVKRAFSDLWQWIWNDFGKKIFEFFVHIMPAWWHQTVLAATIFARAASAIFGGLYQYLWTDFGQKIWTFLTKTLPGWFSDAVTAIGTQWTQVENAVKVPVNWVIQYVYDDGIRKLWNLVANIAGLPNLAPIPMLAAGGRIPGFGGGDRHPALLEGGEAVIDKHRTKTLAPLFAAMGVPGFTRGGKVGDKGATNTPGPGILGSIFGGIIDSAKIMAALASGNKVALDHVLESMLPSGLGGAKAGSGLAGLVTALPITIITDLVAKAIKAFAGGGNAIIRYAESFIGRVPYVWGGTTTAGWDCSGFTDFVYKHFGYGSIPRTAAQQQAWAQRTGSPVPGGLAFFAGADGTAASAGHVGIVVGPNTMVDAYGTGFGTRLNTIFGSSGAVGGFGIPPGGFGARKFDQGGWLDPGYTLAYNGTGRRERVQGPGGSGMERVEALLEKLIAAVQAVAPGVTDGLNGVAHDANYGALYSARSNLA